MSKDYSFPEVGPPWFSNLFYASIKASIRLIEMFYSIIDAMFGFLAPPDEV